MKLLFALVAKHFCRRGKNLNAFPRCSYAPSSTPVYLLIKIQKAKECKKSKNSVYSVFRVDFSGFTTLLSLKMAERSEA